MSGQTPEPVLEVRDVVVAYSGRPVLRGASLTLHAGEVVAILGANGSGKSTLVRASLGLVPTVSGEVRLFGRPLRERRPGRRGRIWRRIGYVPQRLGAGSGVPATVREVVSSGRLARRGFARPSRRADTRAVDAAIAAVGLTDRTADPVGTLSGGQQQRTLIARALAGEPELLVLDEPMAGVDAASQLAFADALGEFVERGGTVVLVAHELGLLHPLVKRAVVIRHGEIAHDGPVPQPAGHHADPGHDHVHPHAPAEPPGLWQ